MPYLGLRISIQHTFLHQGLLLSHCQCLTVNYNLNNRNHLNFFIVFRILDGPGATLNGIFGNDSGGNTDRYIAVRHNTTPKELRIGYGNGHVDVVGFPPKANPLTLNFRSYPFTITHLM